MVSKGLLFRRLRSYLITCFDRPCFTSYVAVWCTALFMTLCLSSSFRTGLIFPPFNLSRDIFCPVSQILYIIVQNQKDCKGTEPVLLECVLVLIY
jgi:hypothetical protein